MVLSDMAVRARKPRQGLRPHGIVDYVDWDTYQANTEHLPNPLTYTYIKDERYSDETELRISLSAIGMGNFVLEDGKPFEFHPSLKFGLDYRSALNARRRR